MNSHTNIGDHVGELLSGYVDGELTQQQRQRVELHCGQCSGCQDELRSIEAVRSQVSGSVLSALGEDVWREHSADRTATSLRGAGWFIAIAGTMVLGAVTAWFFLLDTRIDLWVRLGIAGVYVGGALLLLSVLRQRLLERKTDKYKDVEI